MKYSFYTFQVSSYFGQQNNHKNQSIGYKNNPGLSFKVEHFRRSEMLFRRPWLERGVISVTLASLWFLTRLPVLTSDINRAFSSTELPLAGYFQVPVDQRVVNHSGPKPVWRQQTCSTTFKVTSVAWLALTFSRSSSLPEGIELLPFD